MMYVLIKDNRVILGPNAWSQSWFQHGLLRECAITAALPVTVPSDYTYDAAENVRIIPILETTTPTYDDLSEVLAGPYYTFEQTGARITFEVRSRQLESIKSDLRKKAADARYDREIAGTTVELQNQTLSISTSRNERDVYNQQAAMATSPRSWKFNNGVWMTLQAEDFAVIASEINNHVQQAFDWENEISTQIDSTDDISELKTIVSSIELEHSNYNKMMKRQLRRNG